MTSASGDGAALAALLNQCRILVVPSLWAEPFGIVALEGIACGCVVVGSAGAWTSRLLSTAQSGLVRVYALAIE